MFQIQLHTVIQIFCVVTVIQYKNMKNYFAIFIGPLKCSKWVHVALLQVPTKNLLIQVLETMSLVLDKFTYDKNTSCV